VGHNTEQSGGLWSPQEASHHINYLELLAAFLALKAFGKTWQGIMALAVLPDLIGLATLWSNPPISPVPQGTRTGSSKKVLLVPTVLIEI